MRTWIDIAKLVRTKNLKGGLVAQSAAGLPLLLTKGMELALVPPVLDAPRRVHVVRVEALANSTALVFFDKVNSAELAKMLVGCHCLARRRDMEDYSVPEYDFALWVGWKVRDKNGGFVGRIDSIEPRPIQPLLVVCDNKNNSFLIPMAEDFIVHVYEDEKLIELDCPPGLFDL